MSAAFRSVVSVFSAFRIAVSALVLSETSLVIADSAEFNRPCKLLSADSLAEASSFIEFSKVDIALATSSGEENSL